MTSMHESPSSHYTVHSTLPPGLPIPSNAYLPVLSIQFHPMTFLNRIGGEQKWVNLQLEWWGAQLKQRCQMGVDAGIVLKYTVCGGLEGLLGYLNDMRVLPISLISRNKPIGSTYINFAMIHGWKGEPYQFFIDVKHKNVKIGELPISMHINTQKNPIQVNPLYPQSIVNIQNQLQNSNVGYLAQKNVNDKSIGQSRKSSQHAYDNIRHTQTKYNNAIKSPSIKRQQPPRQIISFPTHQTPYVSNMAKYESQLMNIRLQYAYLFPPSFNYDSKCESIELMILGAQITGVEVYSVEGKIPVMMQAKGVKYNSYRFAGKEGVMKINMPPDASQKEVMAYLREAQVSIKLNQQVSGAVKLSKLLSKCGDIIEINLNQSAIQNGSQNQKSPPPPSKTSKLKGKCWIKALPPIDHQPNSNLPVDQTKNNNKNTIPANSPTITAPIVKDEYVCMHVRKYHSLHDHPESIPNYFMRLSVAGTAIDSKTVWQKQIPHFNESFIFKLNIPSPKSISIQVYDRKKVNLLIGDGVLQIEESVGMAVEVPIKSKTGIVGYLLIDYVLDGLGNMNKLGQLLEMQKMKDSSLIQKEKQKQQRGELLKKQENQNMQSEEEERQENISQIPHTMPKINVIDDIQDIHDDMPHQINQKPTITHLHIDRKQTSPSSILQIHNELYFFMHTHRDKEELGQRVSPTEFIRLFQGCSLNAAALTRLSSVYLQLNTVNLHAFREGYSAWKMYFDLISSERDQLLVWLLQQIDYHGYTINSIEDMGMGMKNTRDRDKSIEGIITNLEGLINKKDKVNNLFKIGQYYKGMGVGGFCDALRRFQVYETTKDMGINSMLLPSFIYSQLLQILLQGDDPALLSLKISYNQLRDAMRQQGIQISVWQDLCLRQHCNHIHMKQQYKHQHNTIQKYKPSQEDEHIRIVKSPTFGFLHNNPSQLVLPSAIMESNPSINLKNIAISPINRNDHPSAVLSDGAGAGSLRLQLEGIQDQIEYIRVDGTLIQMQQPTNVRLSVQYSDVSGLQNQNSNSNSNSKEQHYDSQSKEQHGHQSSIERYQSKSGKSEMGQLPMQISFFLFVEKAFLYEVDIKLAHSSECRLECPHGQWVGITTDDGDYLGCIKIGQ